MTILAALAVAVGAALLGRRPIIRVLDTLEADAHDAMERGPIA
jgi:hypothetical protein